MEMNFCRRCGEPLKRLRNHVYECSNGHTLYANQSPTAGVLFVSSDKKRVLLSTRGIEPHKGTLDTLGGFLDANESFEDAAARELHEELDLNPEDYGPLNYITSGYDSYPYQGENMPFVTVLFWTNLKTDRALQPADDVAAVNWYSIADLKPKQLHANDIRKGIYELQRLLNQEGKVAQ
jgi:ADP-ribose pyrophosphatase YjhB (NUDIX family)